MTLKRILGITFIIIAVLLTLAIIPQLPALVGAFAGLFKIFSIEITSFQVGEIFGNIIYWILYFLVIFFLWRFGMKWSNR